jgi:hypothetical protein
MLRLEKILARLHERWTDGRVTTVCTRILEHVSNSPADVSTRISYSELADVAGVSVDDALLPQAIAILSSRFEVLEWHFIYFNDHGEPHDLTTAETQALVTKGAFADPETGEEIETPENKIYPYFVANREYLLETVEQ